MQQASGWWGLLFLMSERQLFWMSRLSPTACQFADTLGTTLLCSSAQDGFLQSRAVLSAEEEKVVADPGLNNRENNQLLSVTVCMIMTLMMYVCMFQ